ncbi:MAG TPA: AmmeMemoRadiSam system protein B [Candidatus Cloacimonadota bacterium]|nr:AmmeMemoRadiSam system protein B [Candidatus Cloacimonadota bacterium]HPT72795.1 AmmeMemoRadiSam system protein B [Candidatus Cloacimonadota bacterium]
MDSIRKESVAGMFYPADPAVLSADINRFLSGKKSVSFQNPVSAIVCPHAGYVYSGDCAASSFHAISKSDFDVAVIIAPSHHSNDFIFSQGKYSHFQTPLGNVKVNQSWLSELDNYPEFHFSSYAHQKEHALEVQLPFLQMVKPSAEIVPILFGQQTLENGIRLAQIIHEIQAKRKDKIMIIISTDLSHYHPQPIAEKLDLRLQADLEALSEESLYEDYMSRSLEACGIGGLFFLIAWSKYLTYPTFTTLQYSHSGMVNQDYAQVVGYLSGALSGGIN